MKWISATLFLGLLTVVLSCAYNPYPHGKRLYELYCAGCHGQQGEGFRDLYPPLADADFFQNDPYLSACMIVHGYDGSIQVNGKLYEQPMLAIKDLNAVEITNILNYIAHSWNPSVPTPLHQDSVKSRLEACQDWPIVW